MSAQVGRLAGQHGSNRAAAAAIGCIHPVVESIFKTVHSMLLVAFVESDEERLAHIRLAIGVGVLGVENLRRSADEHAFTPDHDAIREIHIFQKHSCFVIAAIPIGVFQILDDASRFVAAHLGRWFGGRAGLIPPPGVGARGRVRNAEWIIPHLDHPELPVRAPVERYRINDQRLAHDQLGFETRPNANGPERCFR